jgi:hypothetical protein
LTSNPKTTANCKYVFHARAGGRICQMNRTRPHRGSSKFTEMLGKENSPNSLSSFSWSQNRSWTDRAYRNQQIDRPEDNPSLLSSAHDVPIVDADIIARQVVEPERPGSRRYRQHSKNEVLHPTCVGCAALDRRSSLEMGRLARCLPVSSSLYFYQINLICLTLLG